MPGRVAGTATKTNSASIRRQEASQAPIAAAMLPASAATPATVAAPPGGHSDGDSATWAMVVLGVLLFGGFVGFGYALLLGLRLTKRVYQRLVARTAGT
jgi:hypothetical protein